MPHGRGLMTHDTQDQDDDSSDTTLILGGGGDEPDGSDADVAVAEGSQGGSVAIAPSSSPPPSSCALVAASSPESPGRDSLDKVGVDAHDAPLPPPPPPPPSNIGSHRTLSLRDYFSPRDQQQCCSNDCLGRASTINDGSETWAGYAPPHPWPADEVRTIDEMLDWASMATNNLMRSLPEGSLHILWARMASGSYSTAYSGIDAPGSVSGCDGYGIRARDTGYGTGYVPAGHEVWLRSQRS